jgi:hypothetical protein
LINSGYGQAPHSPVLGAILPSGKYAWHIGADSILARVPAAFQLFGCIFPICAQKSKAGGPPVGNRENRRADTHGAERRRSQSPPDNKGIRKCVDRQHDHGQHTRPQKLNKASNWFPVIHHNHLLA